MAEQLNNLILIPRNNPTTIHIVINEGVGIAGKARWVATYSSI